MFQLPQFVWALRSSVWDVFINFLLIDATDRSKIPSDQKRFFIALSLYPLSFFVNTPFKVVSSFFNPVWKLCKRTLVKYYNFVLVLCTLEAGGSFKTRFGLIFSAEFEIKQAESAFPDNLMTPSPQEYAFSTSHSFWHF